MEIIYLNFRSTTTPPYTFFGSLTIQDPPFQLVKCLFKTHTRTHTKTIDKYKMNIELSSKTSQCICPQANVFNIFIFYVGDILML